MATSMTILLIDLNDQQTQTPYYPGLFFLGSVLIIIPAMFFESIGIENLLKAVNIRNQNLFLNR